MHLIFVFQLLFGICINSDVNPSPVSWSFDIIESGDYFTFTASAKMDKKWVLYSQHNGDDGPVPTYFEFQSDDVEFLDNEVLEIGDLISEMDELFETQVNKFKGEVVFKRRFKSKSGTGTLKGSVEFMTCDGDRCLPPKVIDFNLTY